LTFHFEAPLFGEGGFFKHFDREEKQRNILEKERSVADLKQEWEQKVMTLVDAVKRLEDDTRRAEDSLRLIVQTAGQSSGSPVAGNKGQCA